MKKRPCLGIDVALVNNDEATSSSDTNRDGGASPMKKARTLAVLSPTMGTTYRAEGLSIGGDYLRVDGSPLSTQLSESTLEVQEIVGRGACSVVYKAWLQQDRNDNEFKTSTPRSPQNDLSVALKVFPIRGDPCRREMMVKELRALSLLDCDCLVNFIGAYFNNKEGTVTAVLEYMDQGSLASILKLDPESASRARSTTCVSPRDVSLEVCSPRGSNKALPEEAVAALAFQMLWGLSYLHHENIVHRDIKPGNVLLNSNGEVKLSDFGIASKRPSSQGIFDGDDEDEDQMNKTVVGTYRYMSPERLKAKAYGKAGDVWSLGLVILEAFLGRMAFPDVTSVIELVQTIDETSVEERIPKTVEGGLRELLRGCLQQEPEKRVPARILVSSPWFATHGIECVDDAVAIMENHLLKTSDEVLEESADFETIRIIANEVLAESEAASDMHRSAGARLAGRVANGGNCTCLGWARRAFFSSASTGHSARARREDGS